MGKARAGADLFQAKVDLAGLPTKGWKPQACRGRPAVGGSGLQGQAQACKGMLRPARAGSGLHGQAQACKGSRTQTQPADRACIRGS